MTRLIAGTLVFGLGAVVTSFGGSWTAYLSAACWAALSGLYAFQFAKLVWGRSQAPEPTSGG